MKRKLLALMMVWPLAAQAQWPLTTDQEAYVLQPEHKPDGAPRRQGGAAGYLPKLWPVTPCAGYWGGNDTGNRAWLDAHAKLVEIVKNHQGPLDVLLIGDSITLQWGGGYAGPGPNAVWQKYFGGRKMLNLGIGGDKTQNLLWRMDHGGVDGLEPKAVVLMIGVNNLYFAGEVPIADSALGIKACVAKLRSKLPKAEIIVVNVLPSGEKPDAPFRIKTEELAKAVHSLQLESEQKVRLLDFNKHLLQTDGTLTQVLSHDFLHLTEKGYEIYARVLRPLLERIW